jgi:hypothetical protein
VRAKLTLVGLLELGFRWKVGHDGDKAIAQLNVQLQCVYDGKGVFEKMDERGCEIGGGMREKKKVGGVVVEGYIEWIGCGSYCGWSSSIYFLAQ